jgi:hypothetical protein
MGKIVEWDEPGFSGWVHRMGDHKVIGARAIIVLEVFRVRFVPRIDPTLVC